MTCCSHTAKGLATFDHTDMTKTFVGSAREARFVEQWTTSAPFDFGRHKTILGRSAGTAIVINTDMFSDSGSIVELVMKPEKNG